MLDQVKQYISVGEVPIIARPPLDRRTLRDVIDLSLWMGQLLLQYGATSERVEETVHRVGTALGCDWMDILVSPNVLLVTTTSGEEFRTKTRRVVNRGVNLAIIDAVNGLARRIADGDVDRALIRRELEQISHLPAIYGRWLVVVMVGLACAAFSRLFGGDWPVFGVTFVASALAMSVRQELNKRYFNQMIITAATAFVAGVVASSAVVFGWGAQPQTALAAAVLLLVPGVPLITSVDDLIKGHLVMGFARGVTGLLISLSIALGLLLAMGVIGVRTL